MTQPDDARPIRGFPGYSVDALGNVWSTVAHGRRGPRTGDRWCIALKADAQGYSTAGLFRDGKRRFVKVHRLVLEAFVGPRPRGMVGCHWNGMRNDNRLENLRWDTPRANAGDKRRHGTHTAGAAHPAAKLGEADIPIIRALAAAGAQHGNIAKHYGVSRPTISLVIARVNWPHVHGVATESEIADHPVMRMPPQLARGERNGGAVLTERDVLTIRRDVAAGVPQKDLALAFGVSRSVVCNIVARKSWAHVADPAA